MYEEVVLGLFLMLQDDIMVVELAEENGEEQGAVLLILEEVELL